MIAADMNADFLRKTRHTEIILENLTDLGLNILWRHPDPDPDHHIEDVDSTSMYEVNDMSYFSTIDHFACSSIVFKSIKEAGVIHCGENMV